MILFGAPDFSKLPAFESGHPDQRESCKALARAGQGTVGDVLTQIVLFPLSFFVTSGHDVGREVALMELRRIGPGLKRRWMRRYRWIRFKDRIFPPARP